MRTTRTHEPSAAFRIRADGSLGDAMTRNERLLRLARLRGDRAAELILRHPVQVDNRLTRIPPCRCDEYTPTLKWTEAELRAAWGDR